MPLVNPVPLPEGWRVRGEVIDRLDKQLLREFCSCVQNDRWFPGPRSLDAERSDVGILRLSLSFEELKVDGLWAVCKGDNIQGETQ